MQALTSHGGELIAAEVHRLAKISTREQGQRFMTTRVEADGHTRVGQLPDLRRPDPRIRRVVSERLGEPGRGGTALCTGHVLEQPPKLVDVVWRSSARRPEHDPGDIREALVERALQALVRKGKWVIERGPGEEERRGDAEPLENRKGDARVAGQVIVERDRDRKSSTSPSRTDRSLQVLRGNDVVVATNESDLLLEE